MSAIYSDVVDHEADTKADISEVVDRGESLSAMEPLLLGAAAPRRGELSDKAVELAALAAGFRRSLPPEVATALSDLVRSMNCYYSNLIEGHNTHPVDIERAMREDFSADPATRNLQIEARAHVSVQEWIDRGALRGRAVGADAQQEIHRRFCELLPEELLVVANPDTDRVMRVEPGALRRDDVRVGNHFAVSPGAVPRFLARFEEIYGRLGRAETILAAAAAHHRLLWIHPFVDGNGRVARLMSHAVLLDALDTGGLWSVARGLARGVAAYKGHLMACDQPRRNDLDGRGNLSEQALSAFTAFFLDTCLDQVRFMEDLVQRDRLRTRVLLWAEEETRSGLLPRKAGQILEAVLYRGEVPRGDAADIVGTGDRQARRVVSTLIDRGVLTSESSRAPLRIAFPATLAARWMPGLFPEQA
jgi:Fic family protein